MTDGFHRRLAKEAIIPNETQAIRLLSAPFAPPLESVGDDLNSRCPFVNDGRNSRLAQPLPTGRWTVRAETAIEPGLRPKHILHCADRIIVQGDGPWQLFDRECQSPARGYLDGSDVLLDAENNLFYFTDSAGMLEARSLEDGSRVFSASLIYGQEYYRSFIARRVDRILVVSTEREMDMHSPERPEDSTVEILEFNEPQDIDRDGILNSAQVAAELIRKTLLLLSALQNETLIVATDNQICLLDLDLQIKLALDGEFTPLTMSLSDAGIIYLVVSDKEIPKLWSVRPNGEVIYSAELRKEMSDIIYPPIIGYDHRVFLIKDNYLTAFESGGNCLWEYKTNGSIAGAVVTAENQLLISEGSELGVFQADGRYRTLYEFKGETLQTPPTITGKGDLVVVTDKKLYCLTSQSN